MNAWSGALDLLAQFTGGRETGRYLVVNYAITSLFWCALLVLQRERRLIGVAAGHAWMRIAFVLCLARDLVMAAGVIQLTMAWLPPRQFLAIFPPFEHTLRDIAQIVLAAAFIYLISGTPVRARRLLLAGGATLLACYAVTAPWWWQYAHLVDGARFDATWADWLYRTVVSFWLLLSLVLLGRPRGRPALLVSVSLGLLLLYQSLKLVDMATAMAFEGTLTPLRRMCNLTGTFLLVLAYFGELTHARAVRDAQRRGRFRALQRMVRSRTGALEEQRNWAQAALWSIDDGVITTDWEGRVTALNPAAESMLGVRRGEAVGRQATELVILTNVNGSAPTEHPLDLVRTSGRATRSGPYRVGGGRAEAVVETNAAVIRDAEGEGVGTVLVCRDITESHRLSHRMQHLARHDVLTGLPNRVLLRDRIQQAIMTVRRHNRSLAILFLDLDRFKNINDSLGHDAGDRLLRAVALRLVGLVRGTDTLGRIGGDEFVILMPEIEHPRDAAALAEKLIEGMSAPFESSGGYHLHLSLSIGISLCPDDGRDVDALMKAADAALYQAKGGGRSNYQFFTREITNQAARRLLLENRLRDALTRHEFVMRYQPKLDLSTGAITGIEALVRWQPGTDPMVPPSEFIPIAERTGLIIPIGEWILREVCQHARDWQRQGLYPNRVAVNVSAVQLRATNFLELVKRILRETGLGPHHLELELTESILIEDARHTRFVLNALRDMGVRISVDDFGTGYSSLSYLKSFPIDTLKIDRSFVHDVHVNAEQATIVKAVISIARALRQRIVAEGVETREQEAFLRANQCDEIQGFLFSPPIAMEEVGGFFARHPGAKVTPLTSS